LVGELLDKADRVGDHRLGVAGEAEARAEPQSAVLQPKPLLPEPGTSHAEPDPVLPLAEPAAGVDPKSLGFETTAELQPAEGPVGQARALEALMRERAGLRDSSFIAMSNYYYDEKTAYLGALAEVRQRGSDLTPFLQFALRGVALQSQRLLTEIQHEISKGLFRNLMLDLFSLLKTPKKRVIAERQLEILKLLLDVEWMDWQEVIRRTSSAYATLGNPLKALVRDVNSLAALGAMKVERLGEGRYRLGVRLEWPTEITETAFFEKLKQLPKAKTHSFLR